LQGHIAEVQKLPTVTLLDEVVLQAVVLEVILEMVAQQLRRGRLALVLQVEELLVEAVVAAHGFLLLEMVGAGVLEF
jgi:hypothetical protein